MTETIILHPETLFLFTSLFALVVAWLDLPSERVRAAKQLSHRLQNKYLPR